MTKFAVFTDEGFPAGFYIEELHGTRMRPIYGPVPEPTEDEPNPVAPIIGEEPNPDCLIPSDAIPITEQQWRAFINNNGLRKWQDGHVVPYEPPTPKPVVPDRLSRRQFRLALIDAGLLEQVEGWIATQDIRTQAAYADSSTFLRTDEMLQQGFAGLGFTEEQINQFFTAAASL
ncbi:hypothetical protein QFZ34_002042 [Phyllobacterium ifriqiyense]|uniref:Uncharacterized protein n=1 Tax=Phyllobacterium ifriqiyense TaxID=314238 RepID=A0ABU0S7Y6_9HYPH|nr:hypothetical protein [Phyllobacterium ifriqiyense]MDQ0996860.1 hypothetical protein [Phyllobacterium ifriqiyense]